MKIELNSMAEGAEFSSARWRDGGGFVLGVGSGRGREGCEVKG